MSFLSSNSTEAPQPSAQGIRLRMPMPDAKYAQFRGGGVRVIPIRVDRWPDCVRMSRYFSLSKPSVPISIET